MRLLRDYARNDRHCEEVIRRSNLNEKMHIGLDIGGTKIEAILWDKRKVIRAEKISTPKNKPAFFNEINGLIKRISVGGKFSGIGIGVAGALDYQKGVIYSSPNIRFLDNFNLKKALEAGLNKKVLLDNDTKCFLRAEMAYGFARGKKNVVALTLGTGLGGAVLAEGNIIRGTHHGVAQLSRMILYAQNYKILDFEDLVSSHGFKRLGVSDPLKCQNRAFAGDKKAIKIYDEIGKFLGVGLANVTNIFDPELIVIGGGIARAGDLLLRPARGAMAKRAVLPRKDWPDIRISKLEHPVALGAVSMFD